jgi:2-polyprenyl-3-methyl-5-hydroxy-6-metoxy-1,4-benzoquinol methylase
VNYEKLSTPVVVDFPQEWFDMNQENHFWFSWRLRALRQLLADNSLPAQSPLQALEIGCGIGFLRQQIESITAWTVDGADVDEHALKKNIPGRGKTMLYRIEDRLESFKLHYDVLVLFDVLEHIENPGEFLKIACWHLKGGGYVIINVPALTLLFSQYDRLVGHYRRYNQGSLRNLIREQVPALEIVDVRYWGMSLVPIAWLRKLVVQRAKTAQQAIEIGFATPTPWINRLFRGMMRAETSLLTHPVFGSSVMALIRKPK